MSRPPRPLFHTATAGDGAAFAARRQFLPLEFAELVQLQQVLAETEARLGVTAEEGDFAYTLLELSALVAHTLGLYQNLYAREAYLGTAETAKSLILHARRLAYEPDRGLAASGYAVLTVGQGLQGKLPAGFALSSSPRGEVKAQTFETLTELAVDAARNEALPVKRTQEAMLTFSGARGALRLSGSGLNLAINEYGILVRDEDKTWEPVSIVGLDEEGETDVTVVTVELLNAASSLNDSSQALAKGSETPLFRLLAKPKERLRRFGWDADPVQFPPSQIKTAGAYTSASTTSTPTYGYDVVLESGDEEVRDEDIYLSGAVANLRSTLVVARRDNGFEGLEILNQGEASVAFRRGLTFSFPIGVDAQGKQVNSSTLLETEITGTVTYLQLQTGQGNSCLRSELALPTSIYADWQFEATVLATEPNPEPVTAPLALEADFGDFRPGGVAVFETLDGSFSQVVEVQRLNATGSGATEIWWAALTPEPDGGWLLHNLRVFGNVVRVTHGETVEEVLGGSDGVTPFQRFELKQAPLTQVPGAAGGDPAVEVRVNDVAWTRVDDFYASTAEDRHYRLEVDENQKVTVIFGNGRKGAIPPSGKKHIRAVYRKGLGVDGNVDRGAAGRIKKAHPLIDRAANPTSIGGGANPAGLADLKRQSTRYIRTFDRAVSVQDHADLALLYPGVARAAARIGKTGLEVIVATADGSQPLLAEVEAFLNARRDTALALQVSGAESIDLFLDLYLEYDPAYLVENVKLTVRDALLEDDATEPGMFTFAAREFGQAAHLSEVYARLAAVEGVTFVDVTRFRIEDDTGVMDVLQVSPRQWLRLPQANLMLSLSPGVAL